MSFEPKYKTEFYMKGPPFKSLLEHTDELAAELQRAYAEIERLEEEVAYLQNSGLLFVAGEFEKSGKQNKIMREALEDVCNNLGVPQTDYPAPVTFAYERARKALEKVEVVPMSDEDFKESLDHVLSDPAMQHTLEMLKPTDCNHVWTDENKACIKCGTLYKAVT